MSDHVCAEIVPIFTQLNHQELVQVSDLVVHHHFDKNEVILGPDNANQLVIVAQGAAKVYQLAANGKEQLLRVLDAGDFEGEKNLFAVANQDLYVETLKNSTVCTLSVQDFQPLLEKYPSIAWKLLQSNATKIASLEKQNELLNHDLIEQRLATYLLDLSKVKGTTTFDLPMKLKELASFLGTTPETISRKFKQFEQQQLIKKNKKAITLAQVEKLTEVRDS